MQKFLLESALCDVSSSYNFHWFINLDLSSVSHVMSSAALTLSDNNTAGFSDASIPNYT